MRNILTCVAYTLIIISTLLYLPYKSIAPYLMAAGAAVLFVLHFMERYEGRNLRLKRIIFIRHLIGVAFGVSAYYMFKDGMYWVMALMIASVLEIYTLWVIKKEQPGEE